MEPDKYFHNIVDQFINGDRVPFALFPSEYDNILQFSAPALAQIMEVLNSVHAVRKTNAPEFFQYFRTDESNKVSMGGYTVTEMTNAIVESPLTTFYLYVRDLRSAIEGLVSDERYNDTMVDYFRRSFDYRWRYYGLPANERVHNGYTVFTKTGQSTVNVYDRVSAGQWPFTINEIRDMVSSQDSATTGASTPTLGHIWTLQSLLYSSPQTENFYTDSTQVPMATRVRAFGEQFDESFWYNQNTQVRSFFRAGQWGNWSVIDGEWSSSNGIVSIDTSIYQTYPWDRDEVDAAGFWNTTLQEGSLVASMDWKREAVAVWAREKARDEFTDVLSENGTNVLSHGVGGESPLYGILRYGPGSKLSFVHGASGGDAVWMFGTSNIAEFNGTDGPYSTTEDGLAKSFSYFPNTSDGRIEIDIWQREALATTFQGHDPLIGGQLTFFAIGATVHETESFEKEYTIGDMITDEGGLSATSDDGYLKLVGGLGSPAAAPTDAWYADYGDQWWESARSKTIDLSTTIGSVTLTYPTILTTEDV